MAVDTENKRRGAFNNFLHRIMPAPDGTVDDNDRMQATGYYSGIELTPPVAGDFKPIIIIF